MVHREKVHGRVAVEDVWEYDGEGRAITVDGDWISVGQIHYGENRFAEAEKKKNAVGSTAIRGITGEEGSAPSVVITGGPHPESVDFGVTVLNGLENRVPFMRPFPPVVPNAPDMY